MKQVTHKDVMRVLNAWASPDDWSVPSVYPSVVDKYLKALFDGDAIETVLPNSPKFVDRSNRNG